MTMACNTCVSSRGTSVVRSMESPPTCSTAKKNDASTVPSGAAAASSAAVSPVQV